MSSYKDLLKQRELLDQQIKDARQREIDHALTQVKSLVAEFGLTAQEVFPTGRGRRAKAHATVAPKYRNSATGATWTGRGKPPKWIQGQDRSKFAIG
ncbi:MAG: DNA-binding protein H-NS [Burkholderiaceae bacterium]|jgi:DNA-binding protein H-NS|nr:MAG: DNA-binding protein H-NS [Burkholderiaceae bacterium]